LSDSRGMYVLGSNNFIHNNNITTNGNNGYGIDLYSGTNSAIYDNNITTTGSAAYGIYLRDGSSNNSIQNNTITTNNTNGYGVCVEANSNNSNFSSNSIYTKGSNGYGIYFSNSTNNTISGNRFNISSAVGIYLIANADNNSFISNNVTTTSVGAYGFQSNTSTNSNLIGNKINTSLSVGIYIIGTTSAHYNHSISISNLAEGLPVNYTFNGNNLIYQNVASGTYGQVVCAWCTNVTYNNFNMTADGFAFYNTSNSKINNSGVNTSVGYGVLAYGSSSSYLQNNTFNLLNITILANDLYGVLFSGASGNNITNSNIYAYPPSQYNYGLYLSGTSYNNILNNNLTSWATGWGKPFVSSSSTNNNVSGNNVRSYYNGAGAWQMSSGTNSNRITNNNFTSVSDSGLNINDASGNTITNNIISNLNTGYIVAFYNFAGNNVFVDNLLTTTGSNYVYNDYGINNFTNCTISKTGMAVANTGKTNVFWYADTYVNDSNGNALNGANVSTTDVNSILRNWSLTNSSGYTSRITLREFMQNSSGFYYDTNYTFNASKSGYANNWSIINLTTNYILPSNYVWMTLNNVGQINLSYVNPTPNNGSRQIANSETINVSVNGTNNIGACLLSWNSGAGYVNETMTLEGSGTNVFCSKTKSTADGTTYLYKVYANDTFATVNVTSAQTFRENAKPPVLTLNNPNDGNHTTNRTPQFSWAMTTDDDGDTLTTQLNITPNCASFYCDSQDFKLKNVTNNGTSYALSEAEKFMNLYEVGDYPDNYTWKVITYDGYEWSSSYSDTRTIFIDSEVVLTLINNATNFGTMSLNENNETTDDNPNPLLLQNDGNCFVDVNLSSSDLLWNSISGPSNYYLYKIDRYAGWNSFNFTESQTTWEQVSELNVTSIAALNYNTGNNRSEIDLNVTVPGDETPGSKSSVIVLTGYYIRDPE